MYLSSLRFNRKRRSRSAAPTSLIIKRPRHPFFAKTDAASVLMGALEMASEAILMEKGWGWCGGLIEAVDGRFCLFALCSQCVWGGGCCLLRAAAASFVAVRVRYGWVRCGGCRAGQGRAVEWVRWCFAFGTERVRDERRPPHSSLLTHHSSLTHALPGPALFLSLPPRLSPRLSRLSRPLLYSLPSALCSLLSALSTRASPSPSPGPGLVGVRRASSTAMAGPSNGVEYSAVQCSAVQ